MSNIVTLPVKPRSFFSVRSCGGFFNVVLVTPVEGAAKREKCSFMHWGEA